MHGFEQGLALSWSDPPRIQERAVTNWLTPEEIRTMTGWHSKLIVSGACKSAFIAGVFLDAGAAGVIAPRESISWANLGDFFQSFYIKLYTGRTARASLAEAITKFPEYKNFVYLEPGSQKAK